MRNVNEGRTQMAAGQKKVLGSVILLVGVAVACCIILL